MGLLRAIESMGLLRAIESNGPSTGRMIDWPNMGRTIRGPITDHNMGRKRARVEIVRLWPEHNGSLIGRYV
jgi:hypothetical protein